MRTGPPRAAVLVLPLALALTACGTETEEPGRTGDSQEAAAPQPSQEAPRPESAEDFLDLAEKAMADESAWSFSVEGEEGLTLQGQKSAATYEGTVRRAGGRAALHSQGVSTSSKGAKGTEELYVVEGAGYLKEDAGDWKAVDPTGPEMENKVEDPVSAVEDFRGYARAAEGDVRVTRAGTVELRVTSGRQKLSAVRDRAWAEKARREFEPTAEQLGKAGIPVRDGQLTLSGLEEVLVLDAKTYRIKSHRLDFGFLIPYDGQEVSFEQRVSEKNQGPYAGKIELPAELR
ncbi:hypothetical protein ACIA6T_26050 [Streptomyces sp. NPDC051740]|uniref:hypothetical protein n=1 Tax=Streptomyces sp. NPDC051740 TaxID=3365673 RepID=UPI00378C9A82